MSSNSSNIVNAFFRKLLQNPNSFQSDCINHLIGILFYNTLYRIPQVTVWLPENKGSRKRSAVVRWEVVGVSSVRLARNQEAVMTNYLILTHIILLSLLFAFEFKFNICCTDAFAKLCPEGVGRGDKGEDLNECDFMTNPCDGGECINTDGSYRCECPAGYVLDSTGKKCVDENECKINVNICGNGTCTNLQGGFECICADGFAPGPTQVNKTVFYNLLQPNSHIKISILIFFQKGLRRRQRVSGNVQSVRLPLSQRSRIV